MSDDHGPSFSGQLLFKFAGIQVAILIAITKYGPSARKKQGSYRGVKGIGRAKNLVASFEIGAKAVSHLLTGSTEKALFLWGYDPADRKSLKKRIDEFLERLGNLKLEKFNFIATQEIKNYIGWGSRQQNVSQSEFLRQTLAELIKKDPKYPVKL